MYLGLLEIFFGGMVKFLGLIEEIEFYIYEWLGLIGVYFRFLIVYLWIFFVLIIFFGFIIFLGNMIVKSLEEVMLKVWLGGEIKKEVVEEE